MYIYEEMGKKTDWLKDAYIYTYINVLTCHFARIIARFGNKLLIQQVSPLHSNKAFNLQENENEYH